MIERERWHTGEKIKLMIVDDHPVVRDGIVRSLEFEDDIEVIAQCDNGESALRIAGQRKPDVIILDINLPQVNGMQVARQIKSEYAHIAIVMLTGYHDAGQVLHAIKAGAQAYCSKDIPSQQLIDTIRAVAHGQYVIDDKKMDGREVQQWYQETVEKTGGSYAADTNEAYGNLSPREMEILSCVTNGLSNKEIARRLRISQQTVKNHMTSILKKLNVQDRTQAAVMALSRGWVRVESETRNAGKY
ncbi:MAG: response regulator transcription factor [bacterium]|nr:response regulator transcription factor [bacterium]